ncbi:MAG: UDP-N-acetylmuramoyl-tripeptide--D-alanyl-D-alanine ligase [Candidatus Staskawiczbacteria bacterium]|nr:UDP-N-acetylmuramoyl-tripeptide--D-alanyl-D-alanine ligase [Candidatus Staskawiczbacteria bacterium]
MFLFLSTLWYIRTLKHVLFWLYLWQLKEYHAGRFLAHFETKKGQKLILNPLQNSKVLLAVLFLLNNTFFVWILSFIYFVESFLFFKAVFDRKVKSPKLTKKTFFLIIFSSLTFILFPIILYIFQLDIIRFTLYLLFFDILVPFIVTMVVFSFQPFVILIRNNIIRKAKNKIKNLKLAGNLTVVGITGSYGKTSTKEFLSEILSYRFKVLETKEHQNSEVGISKCILDHLDEDHEIFVVEMGAYNKDGIKLLSDIVKPDIGIVPGVNEQHLALFGSLDNLLSAEGGRELANSLSENGLLILNGDNKYCLDLYKRTGVKKKIYTISKEKVDSDIWVNEVLIKKDSVSFVALTKEKEVVPFNINVLGRQSVQNMLASILAARHLGMSFNEIIRASKNIKQEQCGISLKNGKHGVNIIDSSYSSNPDGVMADLEYLSIFLKKKVIIMPCLIELGEKSTKVHEKIGSRIGKICDLAIITTEEKFSSIKKGAIEAGMDEKNIVFSEKPEEIATRISVFCTKGDTVLLEGRVPEKLIKLLHV